MRQGLVHRLNEKVTAVLRNWPHPIRTRVQRFPPIPSRDPKTVLVVLCEQRHFQEGCWSAWSWMQHLNDCASLVLLVDGEVTGERSVSFCKLFPNGRILSLPDFLASGKIPDFLQTFVAGHKFGRKLAAIWLLQQEQAVLYSDCDVIAFRRPEEIIALIRQGNRPCYLRDPVGFCLDPWFVREGLQSGLEASHMFNAGLVYFPQDCIQTELLAKLLGSWQAGFNHHFAEQTLLSLIILAQNGVALPSTKYVLSWDGVWFWQKDSIMPNWVVRHYTGPVRHRMYLTAYPWLKARAHNQETRG